MESFPGIAFVIGKTEEIKNLRGKSRSFYFDLYAQWEMEQQGETPFTSAVQLVIAFDIALKRLLQEGYQQRLMRYFLLAKRLREGLGELGLQVVQPSGTLQSDILTFVTLPKNMDYWLIHDKLKERGITLYSSRETLDQGQFCIATLGDISPEEIDWFLDNVRDVLTEK